MPIRSVAVLTPQSTRLEATLVDVMYAITSLSKLLLEIKQELESIKEIMVAIALQKSERP
jgi:hypothetical protein